MSKANISQFAMRTLKVPLTFEEGEANERKTDEFTVKYRLTPSLMREIVNTEEAADWNMAKSLARLIISLPEITNGEGQPIEITEENLEALGVDNCKAIYLAVFKDVRPTQAPTTSTVSPSTSETEPAAQS